MLRLLLTERFDVQHVAREPKQFFAQDQIFRCRLGANQRAVTDVGATFAFQFGRNGGMDDGPGALVDGLCERVN